MGFVMTIISLAAMWRVFQKMGREGWEGVIPGYNLYIIFQELYGDGWRCLMLLIPFYNIYLAFRYNVDLARRFHKEDIFGLGMMLLGWLFYGILGFGSAVYGDGSRAVKGNDPVSNAINNVVNAVKNSVSSFEEKNDKGAL